MPVFQYDPDEGNYWGYMPLNFFSPHQDYTVASNPPGAKDEFEAVVKALHDADIEVILDVVYNHTTEAGADGPNYSYRGICNSTFSLLDPVSPITGTMLGPATYCVLHIPPCAG